MQYIFKFAMMVAQMTTKAIVKTTALFLKAAMKASYVLFALTLRLLEALLDAGGRLVSTCKGVFRTLRKRLT